MAELDSMSTALTSAEVCRVGHVAVHCREGILVMQEARSRAFRDGPEEDRMCRSA